MADIGRERRRRWVEQELDALPHLTKSQRRLLAAPLMENGWQVLVANRAVPPDRIPAFVIGRTGVFALSFIDEVPDRQRLRRLRVHAEETFAGLLSGRDQFVPHMLEVMLAMDRAVDTAAHDPFLAVDGSSIRDALLSGETKLPRHRPHEIAARASVRLGLYTWISTDEAPRTETSSTDSLFEKADLHEGARAEMLTRPFQEWMTFLDPEQLDLVHARFNGPARVSGPAGTGKSVVALHRMARFAKHNPGRLLFTSFVKTLPAYHESGFAHLAPHAHDRAEFVGLHAWTTRFLRRRAVPFTLADDDAQRDAFARAWMQGRHLLGRISDTDHQYWTDEVNRVIQGRGIVRFEDYRSVRRTGREGIRLEAARREEVWQKFYLPYRRRLAERGLDDFTDVVRKALDEVRARPLDETEDYAMVVVDEVQDFTLMELALVHAILGGGGDAQLLLVGDGQQQVYPGGWRLSDAGIPLPGARSRTLKTNYRNRKEVLRFSQNVEAGNTVDDLDGGPGVVLRDSPGVLKGGSTVELHVRRADIDVELVRAVQDSGLASANVAVIVSTRRDAAHYQRVLTEAGLETLALERYDGTQHTAVKVGTVHRAKGMDFLGVFHITEKPVPLHTLSGGVRDQAELIARQTLVALSRARDFLWVAYVTD
ncbi:UvrD-helicase domain-containing protein [Nocardia sp. NPDC127579]|uniref:UvrD-helicase domain-containing protein n=1 Tax=Nocardia sp. NPDC127579 TaxID=3345402 RepID=UPI0036378696